MKSEQQGDADVRRLLDRLTRRERGRLIASLTRRLGSSHLELAEDVAQEALMAALSIWPYKGMPDNPAAWLTRVARNKAIDRLRRENRELAFDDVAEEAFPTSQISTDDIGDPELQLMFLCCQPTLDGMDQLTLTLRTVSGFTARDIADVLLSTPAAISKRLSRCRRALRQSDAALTETQDRFEKSLRLPFVLKVVYLMFALGYAPRRGSTLIRRDVAFEALRLAKELAAQNLTARPETSALAALLCFQASRFDAREDGSGNPILLKDQDRTLWDRSLIVSGFEHMKSSMDGRLSRYHLEAGIASAYASAYSWEDIDWAQILNYYQRLEQMTESPVVSINAAVALAFSGEPALSLERLNELVELPVLKSYTPVHIARAEVFRLLGNSKDAETCYTRAIECGASSPVIQHLEAQLAALP